MNTVLLYPNVPQTRARAMLIGAFSSLWVLDVVTTIAFVSRHGVSMEANPIMAYVLVTGGYGLFVILKALILFFWFTLSHRVATWIHAALVVIMTPVVALNTLVALS